LSVIQAALLIAGIDPSSDQAYVEGRAPETRPVGYEAARTALAHALREGAIKGKVIPSRDNDFLGVIEGSVDPAESRIEVESLRDWLSKRGIRSGFFFPNATGTPDYLDKNNPRYAPKLAATVCAWLATGEAEATKGKSPKQALVKWLREHAAEYKLSDDEGTPNETGIEECAKVANWLEKGGAPKTPGG
jgi:hypothetical protein